MKPALDHHYAVNSHHPEFYADGIRGMSLLDITEMLCDWKAAALRHADGNILKSIEINQKRFGYSDELKQILFNTVHALRIADLDAQTSAPVQRGLFGEGEGAGSGKPGHAQ